MKAPKFFVNSQHCLLIYCHYLIYVSYFTTTRISHFFSLRRINNTTMMMMKFSNACLLRITITSSVVLSVLGHGRLVDPEGTEKMTTPCGGECAVNAVDIYNVNWFTTGTAPGCTATVSDSSTIILADTFTFLLLSTHLIDLFNYLHSIYLSYSFLL